jgi:hypothetical protein
MFDLSKPGVRAISSTFGGGWALPLNEDGEQALEEFFGEPAYPLAPLGNVPGYIVEPYQTGDIAEHLASCGVAWEVN